MPSAPTLRRVRATGALMTERAAGPAATAARERQVPPTPSARYLPAPPPVSLRPAATPRSAVGPAAPRASAAPPVPQPGGSAEPTLRRSLLDETAALFRQTEPDTILREPSMPPEQRRALSVVRNDTPEPATDAVTAQKVVDAVLADPVLLDELVDKVVDKIERRIHDDLERRGRRFNPGAF